MSILYHTYVYNLLEESSIAEYNNSMAKSTKIYLQRRVWAVAVVLVGFFGYLFASGAITPAPQMSSGSIDDTRALDALESLPIRGDEAVSGYKRDLFGNGWGEINGCDTRNVILYRDLYDTTLGDPVSLGRADGACLVLSGKLNDLYTGETIIFERGENSSAIQIDHVVALSNGWQSGMNMRDASERKQFANDPMNLLAVDGSANQKKSDASADEWLPPNRAAHCVYVARQISVKFKYSLNVTASEKKAMQKVLKSCPDERILR
jgi:hypothetical protein